MNVKSQALDTFDGLLLEPIVDLFLQGNPIGYIYNMEMLDNEHHRLIQQQVNK